MPAKLIKIAINICPQKNVIAKLFFAQDNDALSLVREEMHASHGFTARHIQERDWALLARREF
jgi:hypothetical protein